ncbi:isopeptide-forming domain-containing fimbrial protein, partial [Bacillus anthracis]|uniref:isopeptide-forming domain-containing fimbrial protein n=1 Tax=Bacillus anthracis TaxID=1392 RepID=UPI00099C31A9
MQKYFGFKKYGKRFKQTILSLLTLLLVFSGVAPSTALQTVHAAGAVTINKTDSYGIQGMTLYQFDGANPRTTPKASVPITGVAEKTGLNGLAISAQKYYFYAATYTYGSNPTSKIYKINANGGAQFVTSMPGIAGNSVIYNDRYFYLYGYNGKAYLGSYNLTTGQKVSTEIKNYSFPIYQDMGGDLVFDSNGYIWFFQGNSLIQLNPGTGTIVRTLTITNADRVPIEVGVRGISFLPDGRMLIVAGQSNPKFYTLNPKTLSTTYMGAMQGGLIFDLASEVAPRFEPKPPILESKKVASIQQKGEGNTDAAHPEVGDTLLYTIQARNTVANAFVSNLTISDAIPMGLEYVPGTLKVDGTAVTDAQGDDKGHSVSGKVVGQFGDVTGTTWHTVTFQTKVMPGQAGKTIQNTATVTGKNVTTPQQPTTKVDVYPKDSRLESEKTAKNLQDKPIAVGDEIEYTIKMRNTISDSLVKNAVIEDQLPAGLEYVPGTLQVDGKAVTDAEGDDNGHYIQGKLTGKLGNITDAEWHSMIFHAKVKADQAGKAIQNKATVTGDGITPQEPTTTVEVSTPETPTPPANACGQLGRVALVNGSFEQPYYTSSNSRGPGYFNTPAGTVPGWKTTDSHQVFEIFNKTLMDQIKPGSIEDQGGLKNPVPHGEQFAELNSREAAQLYQDVQTTPGQTIYWRLAHKGRLGTDTMALKIGSSAVHPKDLPTVQQMTTGKDQWKYYTGTYKVPAGQTVTRFGFEAVSSAGGNPAAGNFLDDIFLGTEPCVSATKSVSPEGQVKAGDELTYKVTVKNDGGDVAAKSIFTDTIPAGTEYVPGSIQVIKNGQASTVTDGKDTDSGDYLDGKVTVDLGDLPNTDILPDGVTIQFKVKALSSDVKQQIKNKANVAYKNLLTNTDGTVDTNEVVNDVEPETPTPPANSCGHLGRVSLINGSFEEPINVRPFPAPTAPDGVYSLFYSNEVPGWETTASDKLIQIERYVNGFVNISRANGNQFAELNGTQPSTLYQDINTTSGQVIYWRLAHRGDQGIDTMNVKIGATTVPIKDLQTVAQLSTGNQEWKYYTGTYTVPTDQHVTRFAFEAVSTSTGRLDAGNFLDDIFLGTEPCVSATKSVSPEGQVKSGDELTYKVTVKNDGGDIAANSIFTDAIPAGTEYVPGSIQVTKNEKTDSISDEKDTDSGYYQDGKVTVDLGDLPNTDILPDGVTVQFKVKVLSGYVNQQIKNKANVAYKNLLTNTDGTVETNEVVNTVIPKEANVESKKIAKNLQDKNTEVGDEIEYTIQMRNTVSDSLVKNAVIEDQLPEGLEYVPGTLQVNGKPVTDTEDDDTGHYVQGKFTGQLGDITDTEWHTVVFHAKVKAGQAGQDIQNTAKVIGENVPPQEPSTTVEVYPRNSKVES